MPFIFFLGNKHGAIGLSFRVLINLLFSCHHALSCLLIKMFLNMVCADFFLEMTPLTA